MLQTESAPVSIALPQNGGGRDIQESHEQDVAMSVKYTPTDFNSDGSVDFFDYLDFIQEFSNIRGVSYPTEP